MMWLKLPFSYSSSYLSFLQQATGAVLVSREPNKVILYRGWGEGEHTALREKAYGTETCRGEKSSMKEGVSPQLLAAIRLECGLQILKDDKHSYE